MTPETFLANLTPRDFARIARKLRRDFLAEQRRARRQATDAAAARRRQLAAMRRGPRATDWNEQVWAGTTRYLDKLEARP